MKRIAFKPLYLVALMIAGFAISRSANADVCSHQKSLAIKVDRQSTRLLSETRHYRRTPNYGRMVAEVAVLRAKARHMRFTTFTSSNFHQLEEDLRMVDRCFHKVEAFFDAAEISAVHGVGKICADTRHVRILLDDMAETIHYMRADVRDFDALFLVDVVARSWNIQPSSRTRLIEAPAQSTTADLSFVLVNWTIVVSVDVHKGTSIVGKIHWRWSVTDQRETHVIPDPVLVIRKEM